MLKLYKKTNKNKYNLYGCQEITNINDLNKPFLLGISGYNNEPKAVFGMIREAAHAARIYTTQETAAGFDIEHVPMDFLGYTYEKDESELTNSEELVNNVLYPFLLLCGRDYNTVLKQANKINIMTFGNGIDKYTIAEQLLMDKLEKDYKKSEYKNILSNIKVIVLGSNNDLSKLYATNISFLDINTKETETKDMQDYRNILGQTKEKLMYAKTDGNVSFFFYFLGNGIYTAKNYLKDDCIAKAAISAITALFLKNSIYNLSVKSLAPITREDIIETLYYYASGCDNKTLLNQLDNSTTYNNSPKYTPYEAKQRKELDETCEYIRKLAKIIENRDKETVELSTKINKITKNIREYSSETTYYQILTASNLWFSKKDILKEESDKTIREKYDKKKKK